MALEVWQRLDLHDREYREADGSPLYLTTAAMAGAVRGRADSEEIQEMLAALEREVMPMRLKVHRERLKKAEKSQKGGIKTIGRG